MEADLQRWYQIDYRTRWTSGPSRLTLRRLWVLISHLPPDSSVMVTLRDGEQHWPVEAHLLDDLRIAMTSDKKNKAKPHPARPKAKPRRRTDSPERQIKLRAARRRARERRARLGR